MDGWISHSPSILFVEDVHGRGAECQTDAACPEGSPTAGQTGGAQEATQSPGEHAGKFDKVLGLWLKVYCSFDRLLGRGLLLGIFHVSNTHVHTVSMFLVVPHWIVSSAELWKLHSLAHARTREGYRFPLNKQGRQAPSLLAVGDLREIFTCCVRCLPAQCPVGKHFMSAFCIYIFMSQLPVVLPVLITSCVLSFELSL